MARYIDAEKFISELEEEKTVALEFEDSVAVYEIEHTMNLIGMQPTADVVPKSEVARLIDKWIGEEKLTQDEKTLRLIEALRDEAKRYERHYFNHEYDKLISEAKFEVAREIFEEIEKIGSMYFRNKLTRLEAEYCIAELKKKYTEE